MKIDEEVVVEEEVTEEGVNNVFLARNSTRRHDAFFNPNILQRVEDHKFFANCIIWKMRNTKRILLFV